MSTRVEMTPAMFQILLALADRERHGYAILREVSERTEGGFALGPGTLYRSLARLLDAGWVEEIPADGREKPYRLTDVGRARLREEAEGLSRTLTQIHQKRILPGSRS